MRRVWLAAAVSAAMFSFVLLAPQLSARVGQAQGGRGNLLRFCPGLGIPCVEITREAYDRGHEQFRQSCGFCHGPTAAGGNGPNLLFSAVIRRDNEGADITKVIREGRPDKGMPVVPLTPTQVADIVGYLKARVAEVDKTSGLRPARDYDLKKLLTGNAELGKAYFNGAGQCATCHSPAGDLKGIATKYPPIELQARLMYPSGVQAAGDGDGRRRETVHRRAGAAGCVRRHNQDGRRRAALVAVALGENRHDRQARQASRAAYRNIRTPTCTTCSRIW